MVSDYDKLKKFKKEVNEVLSSQEKTNAELKVEVADKMTLAEGK